MLRNRHQRMSKQSEKKKRNLCHKCGLFYRGHTCRVDVTDEEAENFVCNLFGLQRNPMENCNSDDNPTEQFETASLDSVDTHSILSDNDSGPGLQEQDLFGLLRSFDTSPQTLDEYKHVWDSLK